MVNIYQKCHEMLTGEFMQHKICAVCDEMKREIFCQLRTNVSELCNRCRSRLALEIGLSAVLIEDYNVSIWIPELKNVFLSKKGVEEDQCIPGKYFLRICDSCYTSLMQGNGSQNKNPPKVLHS